MKIQIAIAALLGLAAAAHADTVTMKFTGTGQGRSVKITALGNTFNVFSGQLKHQITSGTGGGADLVGNHVTFCTDLAQYVTSSSAVYEIKPVADLPKSNQQGPMGPDREQAIYDIYAFANGQQVQSNANADFASAFQIAIWEIVCDYNANMGLASLSVNGGAFKAKSTNGQALSQAILGHLNNIFASIGSNAAHAGLRGLASDSYQDQLVMVPLPAPVLIGFAGLGLAAIARRRFHR